MLERNFDELLAEERAYALRHLANREEYERMRTLLHHAREEGDGQLPVDADPAVREHVLQVFRAQRHPRWTIWLNSLGGFLLPARPMQLWRPVLTLGTLAVLVFTAVEAYNSIDRNGGKTLAEVKQQNTPPAPVQPARMEKQEASSQTEEAVSPAPIGSLQNEVAAEPTQMAPAAPSVAQAMEHEERTKAAPTSQLAEQSRSAEESITADSMEQTAATTTISRDEVAVTSMDAARQAGKRELKETDRTRAKAYSEVAADNPQAPQPYTEDDLLGLLRAAW